MTLNLTHDYLIGFPSKLRDTLTLSTGQTIHLWGLDYDSYNNHQTVGVVLQAPSSLYGPSAPTPPNPLKLRDPGRFIMPIKNNKEYIFEGAIKEGILPPGTLVCVKPHWQDTIKDIHLIEEEMEKKYSEWTYTVIQPTAIMGYANEDTGGRWKGYGGYVMCKNFDDPSFPKTAYLTPDGTKLKTTVRQIIGGGTAFESGHEWKEGEIILLAEWMGVPATLNMGMDKKKKKGWDVTFVPSDTILAQLKRKMKKYEVRPFGMRVFVRPDNAEEWYNRELGIEAVQAKRPSMGTVIASGPGYQNEPTQSREGMHVLYGKHTGEMVEINGEEMLMMWDSDVWGELKEI